MLVMGFFSNDVLVNGAMYSPLFIDNIGMVNTATAVDSDSIKICGANGDPLSPDNPGTVTLPSTTAGQLTTFKVTANVTINLTGATWSNDTLGDLTNYILCVYAINDNGVLKWGVTPVYGYPSVLSADTSTTASSVSNFRMMLVNSALGGNSQCHRIGWFYANFDDTGGVSENLWFVQSTVGSIIIGLPANPYELREQYTLVGTPPTLATPTWTNNFVFSTSTFITPRTLGSLARTIDATKGDSITIKRSGFYSISLFGDITLQGNVQASITISIIKNQTTISDGTVLLDNNFVLSVVSAPELVSSVSKGEWLAVGDILTIRRSVLNGASTINSITLRIENLTFTSDTNT